MCFWLDEAVSASDLEILGNGPGLTTALMGDNIVTNSFMLGFAFQRGAIPLSLEAIMKAIDLNGAAIEMNNWRSRRGRLAAHDLQRVYHRRPLQEFGRGTRQADARREHRLPRQVPDKLSERGLFEALSRRSRARPRRPEPRRAPARMTSPRPLQKACSS